MGITSNETVTRTELIDLSLRQLGNTNPSDTDRSRAVVVLNAMLKQIDPKAKWSWTSSFVPAQVTTVASQRAYGVIDGLNSNIFELETVERVTGTTLSPIQVIDTPERLKSVDREQTGEPRFAYLQRSPLLANQKLEFLPTPNGAYIYQYTFRRRLYDFTAASDNPDFPGEWNLSMAIMLADKLAREYGLTTEDKLELRADAQEQERLLLAANSRESANFIPPVSAKFY